MGAGCPLPRAIRRSPGFKKWLFTFEGLWDHQAISEDVDLTYDIRALAPDLVGPSLEPLPPNRSQEKRTKEIRTRLPLWISDHVVPAFRNALAKQQVSAEISVDGEKAFIEYDPLAKGSGYTRPAVMLEFGARSTGEPSEQRPVSCDAAEHVTGVMFPTANPRVMRPERTFWEKATAVHVFCAHGEFRGGDRFARHWHDLSRLDQAGIANSALADHSLALAVARHKAIFFAERIRVERSLITRQPFRGNFGWYRLAPRCNVYRSIMPRWWRTDCCLATQNPLKICWRTAATCRNERITLRPSKGQVTVHRTSRYFLRSRFGAGQT